MQNWPCCGLWVCSTGPLTPGVWQRCSSEPIAGLTEPLDGLAEDDWAFCLSGLEAARCSKVNRDDAGALIALDAHPHLRAYFAQQLRGRTPPLGARAHRRLYEHLCASTSDQKAAPPSKTSNHSYQAVAHGCLAGMQQAACGEVYSDRILRRDEYYSVRKLGAFGSDLGAVACFSNTLAACLARARKRIKRGCWPSPPSTCAPWVG